MRVWEWEPGNESLGMGTWEWEPGNEILGMGVGNGSLGVRLRLQYNQAYQARM